MNNTKVILEGHFKIEPMLRFIIHYGLHFVAPILIAKLYDPRKWKDIYKIFLLSMLVDLDHLLSTPLFDPHRLSVGYHYFHSFAALGVYAFGLFFPRTRILSFALIFHMFTDVLDYGLFLIGL